ncbi:hypothetical protein [Streptomyces niveus]|uniref:hypothetical protein n=1 Tax=Streptomyces niveus TaxID=193462 RepID=UPI00343FF7A5
MGTSVPFGIGAYWTDRVSYRRAIEFMSGSRCYFGDYTRKTTDPVSDEYGPRECMKGVARRGAVLQENPDARRHVFWRTPARSTRIHVNSAVYKGLPVKLPEGTPEIVRLIGWGVGVLQSEHVLITGLVQFAESYPDKAPEGVTRFVREWARIAVERSDNFWDFRRYSDDRWTIPAFTGGGADDPN